MDEKMNDNMNNNMDDKFTELAAQAGRMRRKSRRRLITVLVVALLLIANLLAAVKTGVPIITLYSTGQSTGSGSSINRMTSLGFTVCRYETTFADYTHINPWFCEDSLPLVLSLPLYEDLLKKLTELGNGQSNPESEYLKTDYFIGLHIYSIEDLGGSIKVYGYLRDGVFALYDGAAYEISGSSMPVVISADLSGSTIEDSTALTITDLWQPEDGEYYADSIREAFPFHISGSALQGKGDEDAAVNLEKAAAFGLGVPISDNLLMLDYETGHLEIVKTWDTIGEDGNYQFNTQVIHTATLEKRVPEEKRVTEEKDHVTEEKK